MNGFLLDTNVVSELFRQAPNEKVTGWVESIDESLLYISVLTLGEIQNGIVRLPLNAKRTRLETWLEVELTDRFEGRIIPVDRMIADRWGSLTAQLRRTLPVVDTLLAATALQRGFTFVTRNTRDIAETNVNLFNPWL